MRSKIEFLLVGLGNPAPQYKNTRHNLGIRVLRAWFDDVAARASSAKPWRVVTRFNAEIAEVQLSGHRVTCLFPHTFMNKSGIAVRDFMKKRLSRLWHPLALDHLLIIHDDIDLPIGTAKLKPAGSARGHNGVRSIQQTLGSIDIPRLLLGAGPKPANNVKEFVLTSFTPTEEEKIAHTMHHTLQEITAFIADRSKRSPRYPTDE